MFMGNTKNFGKQVAYADKRNAPAVIIEGSQEREQGIVQIKDLIVGKETAAAITDNAEYKAARPGQFECKGDLASIVAAISELPAVAAIPEGQPVKSASERYAALVRLVESRTVTRSQPPLLLPAGPYFDLAGEEFGRNLLLTTTNNGVEYCLRPDFTLPIAQDYIEEGMIGTPSAFTYLGPIFRQERSTPVEFEQAGLELLGQHDSDQALDQVLTFARWALAIYDITAPNVRLGGVGLFESFLEAADVPAAWRSRIRHRFGHPEALERLMERLTKPEERTSAPDAGQPRHRHRDRHRRHAVGRPQPHRQPHARGNRRPLPRKAGARRRARAGRDRRTAAELPRHLRYRRERPRPHRRRSAPKPASTSTSRCSRCATTPPRCRRCRPAPKWCSTPASRRASTTTPASSSR